MDPTTELTRRTFLAGVGTAAGTAALAGCGGQTNPAGFATGDIPTALRPDQYADRFTEVVNLVEDYGADPTGEKPIDAPLRQAWDNDTLIIVPKGEYKMNRGFRQTTTSNIGLIGQNAVIRHGEVEAIDGHTVESGEYSGGTMLFRLGTADDPHGDLVFGGFIFDWSWSENAGMQGLNTVVNGRAEIRNIQFYGVHSLGTHGNLRIATLSPDSLAIVDSIDLGHGRHYRHTINSRETVRRGAFPHSRPPPSWSTTALTCHPKMEGTIHYNNLRCGAWPDNGIYVQGGEGRKIVTNCVATNSNIANIRFGEGDAWEPVEYLDSDEGRDSRYGQSTAENCTVVVDHSPDEEWYQSQRGIWLRKGECAVRDCQILIDDDVGPTYGPSASSAVGLTSGVDQATIERLSIELHTEGHAIFSNGAGDISVSDVQIDTVGWEGNRSTLIYGVRDVDAVQINAHV